MKLNYVLFATFGFVLSCKNIEEIKVAPEAESNTQKAEAQLQAQRSNTNPFSGQSVSSATTFSSAVGVKINPPHGEPGHRCEIPVGAPLDGSSQVQNQQPAVTVSQPVEQQINVTPQSTQPVAPEQTQAGFSGKPNPPHGEPGHRCDIAVGATLP
ncbi:Conserved hypothetical protein [Capnocytophaga canimorsus Cc5]|uniref:Uncharacterized protein n=1 Tax=Capnocytophaga canimorsus (strain 5) TaxID=860228 RepID=F9YRG0_CAPCC|nr:hypothetical protein [Capnocytophaga canimorsus]AEK23690.1 Conserved hypothetical protein [Capnocytophaga canimorsus Cc5]WGU68189.1 hypothetical protein QIU19_13055 [Capnocytophaga canimorsus]WGU70709.1 hypothetical protein QIU18_00770 [Capnocytophaga canimorsus]CEN46680.1 conserved hypothetical protein [Capnocytophaga canimorsus]VEJ18763.1 Uncharacterised protein [Capnocytophaga canimorsus]